MAHVRRGIAQPVSKGEVLKSFLTAFMAVLALASPALAKKKPKVAPVAPKVTTTSEPAVTPDNLWHLTLSTGGDVVVVLRPDKAPNHVERIKVLTRAGFYNGLLFHRVIDGFMAQTGDPKGTGEGGSPLPDLKAEFNDLPHLRGSASMARAEGVDSANSQFFIVFQPVMRLDGRYTVFGRVQSGMQYVDAIERGEPPANPARIVKAWIESDGPNAAPVPLAGIPAMVAPPQALPSGVPPK
jgi:cyclophilin family peptidyl-prolyl cis-trans isomerase